MFSVVWRRLHFHKILFGVDLTGSFLGVFDEALFSQESRHLIDHQGIAAQENVRVGCARMEPLGLIEHTIGPQLLHKPGVALPRRRLLLWMA